MKRATRAALRSVTEGLQDLLYEVVWRDRPLDGGLRSADALVTPLAVSASMDTFTDYLAREGVEVGDRAALLDDLERLSRSYALAALERLGWRRRRGEAVESESLRDRLQIALRQYRLFDRILRMMAERYAHGANELALLRRRGESLADSLRGIAVPLTILFRSEGPGAADYYRGAPGSRASNRLLADAVAAALSRWPEGRRLRVLEVGAGTGSATSVVTPELPSGHFEYTFTDISAGFFVEAEARFADIGSAMDFRPLDIERDPVAQGFDPHDYDLVIAANVLHATRDLGETLPHCRELLAPCGQVVALENMQGRGWHDLTFGLLDGWWRFDDVYRPLHATASSPAWRRALSDSGFEEVAVLGTEDGNGERQLGSGVILAQGPEKTTEPDGIWVLAADGSGVAAEMAAELSARNQTVVLAGQTQESGLPANEDGIVRMSVTADARESWRSLLEGLPRDAPLEGVVHLMALDGHGPQATTTDLADDVRRAGAGALALVQGLLDSDIVPTKGLWLFTRGALALERDYMRESVGQLAGATLWGFGKSVVREAPRLQPRMIDLDPAEEAPVSNLVNELMFPDRETHIAYRDGSRQVARLVRGGSGRARLTIPDEQGWRLTPAEDGTLERLHPAPAPRRPLQQGEVRVAVEAAGLNFRGVLISLGAIDSDMPMGEEFCGRIVEVASNVAGLTVGDRVVGLGFGAFAPEIVTRAELVAPAPAGVQAVALAAIPSAFVSAELAFQMARLRAGDRVLVHTASGGVGLAAIQLAQAAGAEVLATASAPKQAYLRSLGIAHVFDSRTTDFGQDVVEATGGAGVDMVLNSLTGPGFVEANLACLAPGGRFIELGRRDIWSREAMSEARPDVDYSVLELDALKQYEPERPGAVLRSVMERLSTGELTPLAHTWWPMAEVAAAMEFMRSVRHIGKNVIAMPPLADGRLRADRTYLVTGGLGGIGCLVAQWLADRGAGASC